MTLKQAVKKLGASNVARLIGVPRTTILYWVKPGVKLPKWRAADVEKICQLAEREAG